MPAAVGGTRGLVGAEIESSFVDDGEEVFSRVQTKATEHGARGHAAKRRKLVEHIIKKILIFRSGHGPAC
jgi:hypothetical protein